ncbi:phage tail tube assembly chaperone [Ligilactobacillus cholophilus]|uniref:phage tail tube assembly chaperone n=1 Tax=Ligilactobacillus cholophilus TaxID=3050131 RepID=UPI0025B20FF5|nr:phage tail tube assembly chaperone [Ligilactobacillus cholophilus]
MKIKLDKLPFTKKTYDIKASVKNMRLTYKLQLAFAKTNDLDNKSDEELVNVFLEMFEESEKYLKTVLKLSDKQAEELEDMTQEDLVGTANTIAMKLLGISEDDVKASKK